MQIRSLAQVCSVAKPCVPVLATVGRLSYEKGNDRLLKACQMLKADGYAFHIWLIGDGQERSNLEQMVHTFGLWEHVTFWGFQSNPYPYMSEADLIVVPSRYEGLSTVVTESLILGKPVVTTPCSGMQELLGDSEFGLITEDSVSGLHAGLKRMLDDPGLLKQYAALSAQRGQSFSKEQTVQETERFFINLL